MVLMNLDPLGRRNRPLHSFRKPIDAPLPPSHLRGQRRNEESGLPAERRTSREDDEQDPTKYIREQETENMN